MVSWFVVGSRGIISGIIATVAASGLAVIMSLHCARFHVRTTGKIEGFMFSASELKVTH